MNIKNCTTCHQDKDISMFRKHIRTKDGLTTECTSCLILKNQARKKLFKIKHGCDESTYYKGVSVKNYLKVNLGDTRRRSKRLGRVYNINIKDLENLYNKQKGLCAMTGIEMTYTTCTGRTVKNISVDRINSSIGYEPENIQLVCTAVNTMKSDLEMNEFIELCRKVVSYADNKENANGSL